MATVGKSETVSLRELLVTSIAQTDAVAKLRCYPDKLTGMIPRCGD